MIGKIIGDIAIGLVTAGIVAVIARAWLIVTNRIKITFPRDGDNLPMGDLQSPGACWYTVRGDLNRLSKGQEIWLLLQRESDGAVWPQGAHAAVYKASEGTWEGKINGTGRKQVRIIAVVAPQTSQDFFRYFQTVGVQRKYDFESLKRIPPECKNVASIQVFLP